MAVISNLLFKYLFPWDKSKLVYIPTLSNKAFNINIEIISNINYIMNIWRIRIYYNRREESIGQIELRRGILQGDSLSPLLFILQMNIISKVIERYSEDQVQHTLYMDDLRIITNSSSVANEVNKKIIQKIKDIGMKVNKSKCGMYRNKLELTEELKEIPEIIFRKR